MKFTDEEKSFIYSNAYNMSVKELSEALNRKPRSIRSFLNNRNIDYKKVNINYSLDLSTREDEVLELISKGLSNKEICEKLKIGLPTVKTHISSIYQKLDLSKGNCQKGDSSLRVKAVLWYLGREKSGD